jgi:tight adherence protein C
MPVQILAFIVLAVAAASLAVWAHLASRQRAHVLERIGGATDAPGPLFVLPADEGPGLVARWLQAAVPDWATTARRREYLVQAGFVSASAPAVYATTQLIGAIGAAALMYAVVINDSAAWRASAAAVGFAIGVLAPMAVVARQREHRQERLRRALPDALDLLLVCVEAGVSLDAAILRVGREMTPLHAELAVELLTVNRKQNAGVPREDALRGMWNRTGVTEVRGLASVMIQSERWGTSIARVLRVYADSMRRRRREMTARRAALASTRMVFPLALLILPALLAVIGGPTVLVIREVFNAFQQ